MSSTSGIATANDRGAACAQAGFSPHVGQEAPRIVSTLNLVAAGLGITIVPASLSRLPLEGVTYRMLKGRPALKVPLNLACRRDERSAALQMANNETLLKDLELMMNYATYTEQNQMIVRNLLLVSSIEKKIDAIGFVEVALPAW